MDNRPVAALAVSFTPFWTGILLLFLPGDWGDKMVVQVVSGLVTAIGLAMSRLENRYVFAFVAMVSSLTLFPIFFFSWMN